MTSFRAFLAERGLLPPEVLARAVQRQQAHGGDLALNLLELGAVDEPTLAGFLSGFHQLPASTLHEIESAPAAAADALPRAQALRYRICAAGLRGDRLVVAADRTLEPAELADLEQACGRPVELRIATPVAVARGLRVQFGLELPERHRAALERMNRADRTAVAAAPEAPAIVFAEPDAPAQAAPGTEPEPAEVEAPAPSHGRSLDRTGEVLDGKYRLARRIGEGGLGAVYEAHHLAIERRYAVKVLHLEVSRDVELVARFQHDPQAAAATGHPGIAEVYDVGETADGAPFLVEEHVGGAGLSSYLREGSRLAVGWSVEVAIRVLSALSAAHAKDVLHRNLKPSNVLVVQEPGAPPDVRLVDFGGSAMVRFSESGLVRTGQIARRAFRDGRLVGTPKYLAPEQIAGDLEIDARADLYAAGAILYECVTGRAPFEDPDPQRLAMRVLSDRLVRPIERNPALPLGLDLAILRALARERDERYRTADEMIRDLAPFVPPRVRARLGLVEDEPTQVYENDGRRRPLPPAGPRTVPDRGGRGVSWSAFAAFVSLAAVAVAVAWLRPWDRAERSAPPP
ncbi:MAG: protein kinase, partial [Myxococcales bacterium]|nr:protein kinase [Myxococcales bacterium]